MRKSLFAAAVTISLFSGGTVINSNIHNPVNAKSIITNYKTTYHNNYKASKLKYQQSIKIYQINQNNVKSNGYTTIDNQTTLKSKKVKKINGIKYIYTNLFNGSWIKQSDWQQFQTNLIQFKQAYQKYHAKKTEQSTDSTQASSSATTSNSSSDSSRTQTSTTNNTQSQATQSIVVDDAFKATYRATALAEINKLRASVGVSPLVEDPTLDKIADTRAAQNMSRGDGSISHYDSSGNVLNVSAASQVGLTLPLAENIAMRTLGDSKDAKDIAYSITHQYIDEGPENNDGKEHGHYENLVSPNITTIGIGFTSTTTPDSKGYIYMYDAEEISAGSSQDINTNIVDNLNMNASK